MKKMNAFYQNNEAASALGLALVALYIPDFMRQIIY
jgi:hypothetical protein